MGRENMVDCLAQIASMNGYVTSIDPDVKAESDIVVFRHWSGMSGPAREIRRTIPGIDILYRQDLCHQVPAVVRWTENNI